MMLLTVFLVTLAVMFSAGSGAPELFGRNLYLVTSDFSDLIPPAPCAVIGEKIDSASLGAGDIVIFELEAGVKSIGTIAQRQAVSDEGENETARFIINQDSGGTVAVCENDVTAKVTQTSRILGVVINFVLSPGGVLIIAVIPCVCIVLMEVFKPFFRKRHDEKEVAPVNKQEEIPTFIAVDELEPLIEHPQLPEFTQPKANADDFIPEFIPEEKPANPAAALKAYKQTLSLESPTMEMGLTKEVAQPVLYTTPESIAPTPKPPAQKKKPLSSVKLAQVIATVNERKSAQPDNPEQLTAAQKHERINQAMADYSKSKESNNHD
jgi:hypothetical protein